MSVIQFEERAARIREERRKRRREEIKRMLVAAVVAFENRAPQPEDCA